MKQYEWVNYLRYLDDQAEAREDRAYPYVVLHGHKAGSKTFRRLVAKYNSRLGPNAEIQDPAYVSHLREFYAELLGIGQSHFGICSMAGDPGSILMWSHYAANHTGVAFLFDSSIRIFEKQHGISHHPVTYSAERKVNVVRDGWPGSFVQLFTRKAREWSYEKESRYVSHTGPGLKRFKRSTLVGIVFGCRFGDNFTGAAQRNLAKELFLLLQMEKNERVSGPKLQVFVAEKKPGAFALRIVRLHGVNSLNEYFALRYDINASS